MKVCCADISGARRSIGMSNSFSPSPPELPLDVYVGADRGVVSTAPAMEGAASRRQCLTWQVLRVLLIGALTCAIQETIAFSQDNKDAEVKEKEHPLVDLNRTRISQPYIDYDTAQAYSIPQDNSTVISGSRKNRDTSLADGGGFFIVDGTHQQRGINDNRDSLQIIQPNKTNPTQDSIDQYTQVANENSASSNTEQRMQYTSTPGYYKAVDHISSSELTSTKSQHEHEILCNMTFTSPTPLSVDNPPQDGPVTPLQPPPTHQNPLKYKESQKEDIKHISHTILEEQTEDSVGETEQIAAFLQYPLTTNLDQLMALAPNSLPLIEPNLPHLQLVSEIHYPHYGEPIPPLMEPHRVYHQVTYDQKHSQEPQKDHSTTGQKPSPEISPKPTKEKMLFESFATAVPKTGATTQPDPMSILYQSYNQPVQSMPTYVKIAMPFRYHQTPLYIQHHYRPQYVSHQYVPYQMVRTVMLPLSHGRPYKQ